MASTSSNGGAGNGEPSVTVFRKGALKVKDNSWGSRMLQYASREAESARDRKNAMKAMDIVTKLQKGGGGGGMTDLDKLTTSGSSEIVNRVTQEINSVMQSCRFSPKINEEGSVTDLQNNAMTCCNVDCRKKHFMRGRESKRAQICSNCSMVYCSDRCLDHDAGRHEKVCETVRHHALRMVILALPNNLLAMDMFVYALAIYMETEVYIPAGKDLELRHRVITKFMNGDLTENIDICTRPKSDRRHIGGIVSRSILTANKAIGTSSVISSGVSDIIASAVLGRSSLQGITLFYKLYNSIKDKVMDFHDVSEKSAEKFTRFIMYSIFGKMDIKTSFSHDLEAYKGIENLFDRMAINLSLAMYSRSMSVPCRRHHTTILPRFIPGIMIVSSYDFTEGNANAVITASVDSTDDSKVAWNVIAIRDIAQDEPIRLMPGVFTSTMSSTKILKSLRLADYAVHQAKISHLSVESSFNDVLDIDDVESISYLVKNLYVSVENVFKRKVDEEPRKAIYNSVDTRMCEVATIFEAKCVLRTATLILVSNPCDMEYTYEVAGLSTMVSRRNALLPPKIQVSYIVHCPTVPRDKDAVEDMKAFNRIYDYGEEDVMPVMHPKDMRFVNDRVYDSALLWTPGLGHDAWLSMITKQCKTREKDIYIRHILLTGLEMRDKTNRLQYRAIEATHDMMEQNMTVHMAIQCSKGVEKAPERPCCEDDFASLDDPDCCDHDGYALHRADEVIQKVGRKAVLKTCSDICIYRISANAGKLEKEREMIKKRMDKCPEIWKFIPEVGSESYTAEEAAAAAATFVQESITSKLKGQESSVDDPVLITVDGSELE